MLGRWLAACRWRTLVLTVPGGGGGGGGLRRRRTQPESWPPPPCTRCCQPSRQQRFSGWSGDYGRTPGRPTARVSVGAYPSARASSVIFLCLSLTFGRCSMPFVNLSLLFSAFSVPCSLRFTAFTWPSTADHCRGISLFRFQTVFRPFFRPFSLPFRRPEAGGEGRCCGARGGSDELPARQVAHGVAGARPAKSSCRRPPTCVAHTLDGDWRFQSEFPIGDSIVHADRRFQSLS